ncbi:MAG: hypothetical protein EBU32_14200 [Opitutaceae bacterium]|nr:hypothetical protein [Opitutaceae bacterium]
MAGFRIAVRAGCSKGECEGGEEDFAASARGEGGERGCEGGGEGAKGSGEGGREEKEGGGEGGEGGGEEVSCKEGDYCAAAAAAFSSSRSSSGGSGSSGCGRGNAWFRAFACGCSRCCSSKGKGNCGEEGSEGGASSGGSV